MSHLLFWSAMVYFYPVGNTSAVCLTENLQPESKADVLLLACGDPRHILYTISVDEASPLTCLRPLDITCCDVDVAILARNALLFTLLADDGALDKLDKLWNLFYHMFVDESSLSILFEQCRKLIALAESAETWRSGPYGHFLAACDATTLAGLRRTWTAYLHTSSFSSQQAKRFERYFINGMEDMLRDRNSGSATAAARSAGPLALHVNEAVSRQFRNYWSSRTTDDGTQGQGLRRLMRLNPTFSYSLHGDEFAVHYATDPLCGFHLAEAFASGQLTRPYERIEPQEMVRIAKDQFSRWCTSVSKRLKGSNSSSCTFVIRMFAGDVLKFCQALKYCDVTRIPATPYNVAAWRLSTITLDDHYYGPNAVSPAPLSFNIIDTSNISDHVGLVNLLLVTAPLLHKTPSATLYTEALLGKGDNSSQADLEHICGDLAAMALLLGVIPSTFISKFTTRSNIYADLTASGGMKHFHERLAWKAIGLGGSQVQHGLNDVPTPPQRLLFLPEHLAGFLFRVYLQMFSDEDMKARFQQQLSILALERTLHYTRRSFALLAHFVKTRVQTDWQRVMVLFEKLVMTDSRLLMGQHAYQELCCQLHLLGVYTSEWVSTPALHRLRLEYEGDISRANGGMFRDWTQSSIPQVVTLALVVPRDAIARLEPDFRKLGTPMMQCDMQEGLRVNCFAVTSATLGSLRVSGKGENRIAVVVEGNAKTIADADAFISATRPPWRTDAPLIITFSVPSTSVMDFGRNPAATVGLALRATPSVAAKFATRLGLDLTVFRAKMRDVKQVFVLAQAPVVDLSPCTSTAAGAVTAGRLEQNVREDAYQKQDPSNPDVPQETSGDVHVQMNDTSSAIQSFTVRIDVTDPDARAALADKQTIPTVNSCSASTRSLDAYVTIRKHSFSLRFPLPVDIAGAKLRVARKSSYVEALMSTTQVVAPIAPFDGRSDRDISNRFASLFLDPDDDGTPMLGSIHRLNLDWYPTFKLPKGRSESAWFDSHLRLMFSELEERRLLTRPETGSSAPKSAPDTFLHVKQTLRILLRSAADARRGDKSPERAFALCDTSRNGEPYLYIVVACMRLDVGSHTVVADAFVALATPAVRAALRDANASMGAGKRSSKLDDGTIQCLGTDADETAAWYHLLPRLTERCRTWLHRPNCAYRTSEWRSNEQTLATWGEESPFCTCGLGVGTEILPREFEQVAPYLTRAAFSPLISVPYLEEVGGLTDAERRSPWGGAIPIRGASLRAQNAQADTTDAVGSGRCRTCGKQGGRTCSACKRVWYCSRSCQRADWKEHKKHCRQ